VGPTFCHHTLDRDVVLVIEDTHAQPAWRAVPTVDTLGVRAYVGMPLRLDGETIGSFCVVDQQPRRWSAEELGMLEQLAVSAERELALRVALRDARDSAARLQALVREKEEMVAVVAHDLRTPLQVLTLSTALLERSCTPAQKVISERMTSATGAIRRMADDLLSEHAALPRDGARPVPLGSAKFLQDVVHTMSLIGDRANVALVVGHVDDVTLSIDYAQMLRVFCNLIGNAIKYSPPGSEVTLSAHRDGPWLRMAVADLGSGMGEDEQRHAFDRGWQGAEGLARGDGAGLGLPIVKTLVERHGGQVGIESALGRGTRVLVSLPCR
jgi:signal transduction histidine kinase